MDGVVEVKFDVVKKTKGKLKQTRIKGKILHFYTNPNHERLQIECHFENKAMSYKNLKRPRSEQK